MRSPYLAVLAILLSGCSAHEKQFQRDMDALIDCEYKYASSDLTCKQIYDLQSGCYTLFKMKKK